MISAVLHRPPGLRERHRDRHHPVRRRRPVPAAGRAVPGDHAADGRGQHQLPRRQRQGRRRHRRRPDRAAGQRRREHDVHVLDQFGRRLVLADLTFEIGTNLDDAQVLVQNRVAIAEPQLPEEVRRQGVTVKKQSSNIVLAISLTSPDETYDGLFLSNYATLRLRDELSRVDGVGDVMVRGVGAYAMRVWLDPDKLAARQLTTAGRDRGPARGRTCRWPPGRSASRRARPGSSSRCTVTTLGRLTDPEQFEGIVVKSGEAGQVVYLRDVARVELGAQTYDSFASRSGMDVGQHPDLPAARLERPRRGQGRPRGDGADQADAARRGWSTASRSTPPSSSTRPSTRSTGRCSRPACWC